MTISSWKIYGMVHVFTLLAFKSKKLREKPVATLKKCFINFIKSSVFLGTFGLWMKLSLCYVRNATGGNFTAGHNFLINLLGTLISFHFEAVGRRTEICMVAFHRTLESFDAFLDKRKRKVIESKYFLHALCGLSFGIISLCFGQEKQNMKTSFRKLFTFLLGVDEDYDFITQKISTKSETSTENGEICENRIENENSARVESY